MPALIAVGRLGHDSTKRRYSSGSAPLFALPLADAPLFPVGFCSLFDSCRAHLLPIVPSASRVGCHVFRAAIWMWLARASGGGVFGGGFPGPRAVDGVVVFEELAVAAGGEDGFADAGDDLEAAALVRASICAGVNMRTSKRFVDVVGQPVRFAGTDEVRPGRRGCRRR